MHSNDYTTKFHSNLFPENHDCKVQSLLLLNAIKIVNLINQECFVNSTNTTHFFFEGKYFLVEVSSFYCTFCQCLRLMSSSFFFLIVGLATSDNQFSLRSQIKLKQNVHSTKISDFKPSPPASSSS